MTVDPITPQNPAKSGMKMYILHLERCRFDYEARDIDAKIDELTKARDFALDRVEEIDSEMSKYSEELERLDQLWEARNG